MAHPDQANRAAFSIVTEMIIQPRRRGIFQSRYPEPQ